MFRNLSTCLLVLVFSIFAAGQSAPGVKEFKLSDNQPSYACALATTVNDNIVLFIDELVMPAGVDHIINAYNIGPAGGILNVSKVVAEGMGSGNFHVAWHKKLKRFMLAFVKDGKVYLQPVSPNGNPRGGYKQFTNYDDIYLRIAPLGDDRFLVVYNRAGQVVARRARNTGKSYKGERKLTSSADANFYPVGVAVEKNGNVVVYYVKYDAAARQAAGYWVRVDKNLKVLERRRITPTVGGVASPLTFSGAYDPVNGYHMIAWEWSNPRFSIVSSAGVVIKDAAALPSQVELFFKQNEVVYDPTAGRFGVPYKKENTFGNPTEFYMALYYPNGTVIDESLFLAATDEIDGMGFGVSRAGAILSVWWFNGGGAWAELLY
jgi:hypothetical protein